LSDKLTFALTSQPYGWAIEVRDSTGDDLAILTPPLRTIDTNPRMISGWHFRNADNTAANTGDVNAPQGWRTFIFGLESLDPALTAIGAASAVGDPDSATVVEAGPPMVRPRFGRGELTIDDFGLADLEPDGAARMVYMKYSVCLEWSPLADEIYDEGMPPEYPLPVRERFAACGLDVRYLLTNRLGMGRAGSGASYLDLDVDADGLGDIAAPIERNGDFKRGIAICRGDGTLDLLGLEGGYGEHLVAAYFDNIDWWNLAPPGPRSGSHAETGAPPTLIGDGIIIGKDTRLSGYLFEDALAAGDRKSVV